MDVAIERKRITHAAKLFVDAGSRFVDDRCLSFSASVAYYAVFSIFPLLLLSVSIVGFALGDDASVRERLLNQVTSFTTSSSRELLDSTLQSMQTHRTARGIGAAIGAVALIYGASSVFSELETSFDSIWHVQPPKNESTWCAILRAIKAKAFAFVVVIGTAALLVLSLVANAALGAVADASLGVERGTAMWRAIELVASAVVQTGLFAVLYRIVPHTKVRWRDAFVGGAFTAVALSALKAVFAWYLSGVGSYAAYGAIGAVLALLAWIYVAVLALLYGAELTRAVGERHEPAHVSRAA